MQTTSATWQALAAAGARVETRVTINSVIYTGDALSPPIISRSLMQSGVTVGNVVSAMCTFSLSTTNIIPKSAEVLVEMRLTDGADEPTESEWLPRGTFFISRRNHDPITGTTAFECYDALLKGDSVWEPASSTWPQSMTSVVDELCAILGLQLDSRTTINPNYVLPQPNAGATIRDVLSTIGQYHGANWTVTAENKLRMVPIVDGAGASSAEDDVIDVEAVVGDFYAMPAGTITGIRCTYDDATALVGTSDDIVVDVAIPAVVAADLGDTLIGMTYQPYTIGTAYYDYAVELGDYVRYADSIASVVCAEEAELGPAMCGDLSAPDPAELADEYPYIGSTAKALTVAKAYAEQAAQEFGETLTQQDIFNRLTGNGAAQGLILYNGQLYVNATYVNAGELNAALVHVTNLDASDISSGVIHSNDYQTIVVDMLYPLTTLYPEIGIYPNIGEEVVSGFAINFELGRIYGGEYSAEIESLTQAVTALQNSLVYPKSAS